MDANNFEELRALQEAATNGSTSAQTTLGLAYELGHGVERDPFHASHLYWAAALAGEVRAQFALGMLYEHDLGADPNPALARKWYELAARGGHVGASRRLKALDSMTDEHRVLTATSERPCRETSTAPWEDPGRRHPVGSTDIGSDRSRG